MSSGRIGGSAGVDLVDRRADPPRDLGQAVTVEAEEPDGVLAEHQPQLVLGHAVERVLQPLRGVRPRALEVRVVAAEEDRVDPDLVAHLDLDLVDERRAGEAVRRASTRSASASRGRRRGARRTPCRGSCERRRDPVEPDLGEHEPQVGVAVEDAAQRQLPQRAAGVDVAVHPLGEEVGRLLGHVRRRARSIASTSVLPAASAAAP